MPDQELDVRPLPKPDKHPRIFELFGALAVGESFVLVSNHDPNHLRREFETEHPPDSAGTTLTAGRPRGGSGLASSPPRPCRAFSATPAKSPPGRTIPTRQAPSGNWR